MSSRDWMADAACHGTEPDLFFPLGTGEPDSPEVVAACRRCSVRRECGEYAIETRQAGYWGGMSEDERAGERRRRQRRALRDGAAA
jgi:WhiB family redox-sensing transcriptional regulator